MKTLFTLLMLAAVMLTPILLRADEQLPVSIRSAAGAPSPPKLHGARPWHLADGARVSVGGAELKLDVAAKRWGITMSFSL